VAPLVRVLRPDDDRSSFRSGNPDLDRFFARYAGQNQFRHHLGVTYVAIEDGFGIAGYATVVPSELRSDLFPQVASRGGASYPMPVLRLARLGVDARIQKGGVGGSLVRFVFTLARRMADEVGCTGVVVDAKEDAVGFYTRLGFAPVGTLSGESGDKPVPTVMVIPLKRMPPAGS